MSSKAARMFDVLIPVQLMKMPSASGRSTRRATSSAVSSWGMSSMPRSLFRPRMCTTSMPRPSRNAASRSFSSSTCGESTAARETPSSWRAAAEAVAVVVDCRPVLALMRAQISSSPPTPRT